MTRKKARENAFLAMFASFYGDGLDDVLAAAREEEPAYELDAFGEGLLRLYEENAADVDREIEAKLKGWSVNRLQKVNLAILRISVAELLFGEPDMDSVIINEAVELAKKFGDDEDYQFVNGVLGSISREKAGTGNTAPAQAAVPVPEKEE